MSDQNFLDQNKSSLNNSTENASWKQHIQEEWDSRKHTRKQEMLFPLIEQSFDSREIIAAVECLLTGRLTMADRVREFEKTFATYVGAKYAVMVNSGSSANLLAFAVAANPKRTHHFKAGDEVLVPAVCWSTSVWPIIQMGLKPIFVDADPKTLNIDMKDAERKTSSRTKGILAVHILGNSVAMNELLGFVKKHNLILIEDTCESLGAKSDRHFLGTFGELGTYSFYYSHHITTGEGGMVVCDTLEDYDLLKCLRAHGWSRELSNRAELEKENSDVDPRFLFVNLGYNLRPMEIQAAFGICQLQRLEMMNQTRNQNHRNLVESLSAHPKWKNQFSFPVSSAGTDAVWFGFSMLINEKHADQRADYQKYLSSKGVENRPIVSGNMTRQPALALLKFSLNPESFVGAEIIHHAGLFIGLHTELLSPSSVQTLSDIILNYEFRD